VTCSPGKGCFGPESTTAQYVAYGETTVHPYLCIFYLSPVLGTLNSTSSFTPKRANMPGHDTREYFEMHASTETLVRKPLLSLYSKSMFRNFGVFSERDISNEKSVSIQCKKFYIKSLIKIDLWLT
jgi:hypothetical protein